MPHSLLLSTDVPHEPSDVAELRSYRLRQLAVGYRIFGAMRWGAFGDGHISARDPERLDHFWLAGYGVPFDQVTIDDLVLVGPEGSVVEGRGDVNPAAHHIHWPIHVARPDIVSAAHTHTPYGTPFSALVQRLSPITQESCSFFRDHEIFDDHEVDIMSTDGGARVAASLGPAKAIILRNHGLLTVGTTVESAVSFFVAMERSAEAHVKAPAAVPIGDDAAAAAYETVGTQLAGWHTFQWLARTLVPDPSVVG